MTQVQQLATIFGGLAGFLAVAGFLVRFITRPVRKLVDDLGPLTERNSDGQSVFDEVRSQQRADGLMLRALAEEFPKNGVPTRATVDEIKRDLIAMREKQMGIAADVADLRTAQSAHVQFHLEGSPKVKETS